MLLLQVAEVALNTEPYSYDPKAAERASNPNRRRKWLIPLVLAAQVCTEGAGQGQGASELGRS